MRLTRVKMRNFRCFQQETEFELSDFTALVGSNDVGKSAVLDALAMFFGDYKPDVDDASIDGDPSDMMIACEFDNLPDEIGIDAGFKTSAPNEWMVNRRGCLEVHKVFNGSLKSPKQTRVFLVANHPSVRLIDDLLYLKNSELKKRASDLGVNLDNVDQRINSALRHAIWGSVDDLELREQEIDIGREDAKRVWDELHRQLPLFALFRSDRMSTDQDEEAQGPLKAAVEEALQTQREQLDQVTAVVRDRVLSIARATVDKLREMDPDLAQELNPRFTQVNWSRVFGISLTDDFQVPINKRGSGVRRLILLNFFRAQAERRLETGCASGIIYGIEEPETSQHPANQELLFHTFRELAEQPGCQVIITTHTPVLVRNLPLDSLKYIERTSDGSRRIIGGNDETYRRIAGALGVIPDHNVRLFIGVEGVNDVEFLRNISTVLRNAGEDVLDLAALEKKGEIMFIPVGGSNLASWTHRLSHLNRPEYHIFDRDEQPPAVPHYQSSVNSINSRENATAVLTGKREMENYLHPDVILRTLGVTVTVTDFCDVPELVAEQVHSTSESQTPWAQLDEDTRRKKVSNAKRRLNSIACLAMTPQLLSETDTANDVRGWLNDIRRLHEAGSQHGAASSAG